MGRRVLQVEHRRFVRCDDVFYKWNIGDLCIRTDSSKLLDNLYKLSIS